MLIFLKEEIAIKAAAIDMGTNSSRLLIVNYVNGEYKVIERALITTRLGEGVDKNKFLQEKAINRGIKAVKEFKSKIDREKVKVKNVAVVGTSALRDVNNSAQLAKLIEDETAYKMKVISGSEEAHLIYRGVSLDNKGNNLLVVDIGGGSTEFIWKNSKINFNSLDIGAVRMTERYIADPRKTLKSSEYRQIYVKTKDKLKAVQLNTAQIQAVGVGGTITTLGAVDCRMSTYDREKLHDYELSLAAVKRILSDFENKSLDERKKITGLQPARADIIIAGTIILKSVMENFNIEEIKISENDILYGIIRQISE